MRILIFVFYSLIAIYMNNSMGILAFFLGCDLLCKNAKNKNKK